MRKHLVRWAVFALVMLLPLTAAGAQNSGSLRISMLYEGSPVSGGELTLYCVGNWLGDEFYFAAPFAKCGISLENPAPNTAAELASFAHDRAIRGEIRTVSREGTAVFSNLEEGLYLLVEKKAADGYLTVNPFLVQIPQLVNGTRLYHIEATPKLRPDTPSDSNLPQTGQMKWPVPVLMVSGITLMAAGLTGRRKRDGNGK